jgi:hypothetical protein
VFEGIVGLVLGITAEEVILRFVEMVPWIVVEEVTWRIVEDEIAFDLYFEVEWVSWVFALVWSLVVFVTCSTHCSEERIIYDKVKSACDTNKLIYI